MKYRSTRDAQLEPTLLTFEEAVMTGLAPDSGLYIPESVPQFSSADLERMSSLSFQQLAFTIFRPFIAHTEISDTDLERLIHTSYSRFRHRDITPLKKVGDISVLELFHGPTYAFKDIALQFLGNLFEYFLEKRTVTGEPETRLTVVGATSGDTGGAAIYGLRGKKRIDVFILHPDQRISPFQQAQMTTVLDSNVHNVAIQGTFDDCQNLVKQMFGDAIFRQQFHLGAVNSINWARILAQVTYYFHAYYQVGKSVPKQQHAQVQFVVPTGNFGDILAGFYAKKMGLPVASLVIASNENDILYRFFRSGVYERQSVHATLAPAMDIQISSNFERFLWYLAFYQVQEVKPLLSPAEQKQQASQQLNQWMTAVSVEGKMVVSSDVLKRSQQYFRAERATAHDITDSIGATYRDHQYVLDPHTAVGVHAAKVLLQNDSLKRDMPVVCLATAHPVKFLPAVQRGLGTVPIPGGDEREVEKLWFSPEGQQQAPICIPHEFVGIFEQEQRCAQLPNKLTDVKQFIMARLAGRGREQ